MRKPRVAGVRTFRLVVHGADEEGQIILDIETDRVDFAADTSKVGKMVRMVKSEGKSRRWLTVVAMAGVVGLLSAASGYAELKTADATRLERAKSMRAADVARAKERYQVQVKEANDKLTNIYNAVIEQYERAGDTATVDQLKAELSAVLAGEAESDGEASSTSAKFQGHRELIEMIGPNLVRADKTQVRTADLAEIPHIMLYFSASWCGPCRQFTPSLVSFFEKHKDSRKVMVILVSRDQGPVEMLQYMKDASMPWPAIPYSRIEGSGIPKKYGGRGIPNLVLLNADGSVRSGSYVDGEYVGPRKVMRDLEAILAEEEMSAPAGN